MRIESHLRSGLEQGEFQLHYQPVVEIASQTLVGVDALMRWPTMGLGPGDFIPVAESSGMINEMGGWIVHEACRQRRQWRDRQLPALLVSINVSPLQLQKSTLYDALVHALKEYGIDPSCLQLEFTEMAMLKNTEEAISAIHALKALGVKIALDDFGKGYSNLSYLGRLPLDTLKIDQMFVHNLASDAASVAVTEAIIAIGKALGLRVIAEVIESAQIVTLLHGKDCRQMQGYYLCPPVPADELEQWYRDWQAAPELYSQTTVH